jgi:hypothetical protein
MPKPFVSPLEEHDEPNLQPRDRIALMAIIEHLQTDRHHRPPSHLELVDEMNRRLPKQKNGKPAIISKEQIHRMVSRLRREGLLEVNDLTHFNLYPTPLGERWAKVWQQESGETRKSRAPSKGTAA